MSVPFENYIQIYDLKGEYLQEALEFAVGVFWTDTFSSGRMLQIGGKVTTTYLSFTVKAGQ